MKQVFALALLGMGFFLGACFPMLGDSCENTQTCQPPCGDPVFAQANPMYCPSDAGTGDVVAGDAGSIDASRDAGVADAIADASADTSVPDDTTGSEVDAGSDRASADTAADSQADADAPEAAACDATAPPSASSCVVDERYAVFVSPTGNDAATGTRGAPLKTVSQAIVQARTAAKRVYACDNGTGYQEQVTIDAALGNTSIFGGFSCADWSYNGARVRVRSATGSPLVVRGAAVVRIEDVEFDAPDAVAVSASSIGAIVDGSTGVTLRRVRIVAGKGGTGSNGTAGSAGDNGPTVGPQQSGLPASCSADAGISRSGGGWPAPSACSSRGGLGGTAQAGVGADGFPGIPQTDVNPSGFDNRGQRGPMGADGQSGSTGNAGTPGPAATATGGFTNVGFSPAANAGAGTMGFPGQGGGGGGASDVPVQLSTCLGASGGAGGMGGCGGLGGTGGGAGGASVALLAWMSDVTLDSCELWAGNGGSGGSGGNGGLGGVGQSSAPGGAALASDAGTFVGSGGTGGPGGNGGAGGPGGGGNGGPSYALVFRGPPPARTSSTTFVPGLPGPRGIGGTAAAPAFDGGVLRAPDGLPGSSAMEFVTP